MLRFDRRHFLRASGLGLLGSSVSGWLPALAESVVTDPQRRRRCILLWMTGGASQTDTFDMKPGHANGGQFKEIQTNVPGMRFSEHLPLLAKQADKLAIVRSLTTKEGDHQRGTYLMHTGHAPGGPVRYPTIGSLISKELGRPDDAIPAYVSISPFQAFGVEAFSPGFLGPRYAALTVGASANYGGQPQPNGNTFAELKVDDLTSPPGLKSGGVDARFAMWQSMKSGSCDVIRWRPQTRTPRFTDRPRI